MRGAGSILAGTRGRAPSALLEAVLDEGAVAGLSQPVLVGLVRLAGAHGLAGGELAAVLAHLLVAPLLDLLDRAFGGSVQKLVLQALSGRKPSREELTELRKLLNTLDTRRP